jgi:hypothetical protein
VSRTATRFRTILPSSGRTALGATIAGGVLTGLASAPERMSRLFRRRFPTVAVPARASARRRRNAAAR